MTAPQPGAFPQSRAMTSPFILLALPALVCVHGPGPGVAVPATGTPSPVSVAFPHALVLVLDEGYEIRGCWVEQPAGLQPIWLPIVARGTMAEELDKKMTWYEEDEGRETLRELVEVLEGADSGQVTCPGLG